MGTMPTSMPSWQTLDRALCSDGSELTLCWFEDYHSERFALRVDGQELMHSNSHGSEEKLAVHGCAGLATRSNARVLVGGLGMGFTARAALDRVAADAEVVVVEAVSQVIVWNRDPGLLGQLAGMPLGDPRLSIVEGDVGDVIERSALATTEAERFDAILLDVDNGPTALSTFTDARFTARLREAGFAARTMRVLAGDGTQRRHILWLARPAGGAQGAGAGRDVSSRKRYRTPAAI